MNGIKGLISESGKEERALKNPEAFPSKRPMERKMPRFALAKNRTMMVSYSCVQCEVMSRGGKGERKEKADKRTQCACECMSDSSVVNMGAGSDENQIVVR